MVDTALDVACTPNRLARQLLDLNRDIKDTDISTT